VAAQQKLAGGRARWARAAAMLCAVAMLGVAAWLAWKHGVDTLIVLDAERTLTLIAFLAANAVALFAAAQPARAVSRPLGVRAALVTAGAASVNVGAAAFFVLNATLAASAVIDPRAPVWLMAFAVPAAMALLLVLANLGAPPEAPDDVSDEDLAEAALILTESQRRWSWPAVFEMTGYMALTRTAILAAYFAWIVVGMATFEWLNKAFFEAQPLGVDDLRATGAAAILRAGEILTHSAIWIVFVLVAVVPALFILSAAVWYRLRLRRDRARVRALSQSPAARLMTRGELRFLRRYIERPAKPLGDRQRAVS
jgi:hypothetical protein